MCELVLEQWYLKVHKAALNRVLQRHAVKLFLLRNALCSCVDSRSRIYPILPIGPILQAIQSLANMNRFRASSAEESRVPLPSL